MIVASPGLPESHTSRISIYTDSTSPNSTALGANSSTVEPAAAGSSGGLGYVDHLVCRDGGIAESHGACAKRGAGQDRRRSDAFQRHLSCKRLPPYFALPQALKFRRPRRLQQRHQGAAVAFEPSGQFEFEQHHRTIAGELPDSERDRRSAPASVRAVRRYARARRRRARRPAPSASGSSADRSTGSAQDRAQHRDHVGRVRHQRRALLDEAVASLPRADRAASPAPRTLRGPVRAQARGDQRAGALAPPRPPRRRAHSPEMSRLRRGKSRARGSQPNGISETKAPRARMASARSTCSGG